LLSPASELEVVAVRDGDFAGAHTTVPAELLRRHKDEESVVTSQPKA
jgi:hypothetical protein